MGGRMTVVLVALSAVLWGANFNLSKPVLTELHPLVAGAARFLIAALVMLMVMAARREPVPLIRHAKAYGVLGLVGIGGFNLLFFLGMQETSAVNGALIMATNPLLTALLAAVILGERPNPRHMAALPVALAGVAVVLLGGGASVALSRGDALMLGANLCWAFYNVLGRRLMPAGSGLANTTGTMVMGALALTAAAVLTNAPVSLPGVHAATTLIAMALGGSVLAYLFYNAGLARLGAGRTALFLNLVPVTTMIIAALTGTPPSPLQLAGGLVTIGAVTVAMLPARRVAAA
ncbi:MAG: DMT family transporter [Rhodospirillaceae bacterium]|nr:DMT family transporter [Rhodospirillales bacterium]